MRSTSIAVMCRFALISVLLAAGRAGGQDVLERDLDLADRPIAAVRFEGASSDDLQLLRNNVRVAVGDPYDSATIRADVSRVYSLGRFMFVTAEAVLLADGSVDVIFKLVTQPTVQAVQTIGNRALSDVELRGAIRLFPGGPLDQYLIEQAIRDIKELYRRRGYYLTDVSVDREDLARGVLIFRIIEGPRVRVKAIDFDGAESFTPKQLLSEIKTRKHVFLLRSGVLDQETVASDVATLDEFYKDRGFLKVRVGHTIDLSSDSREAKVIFFIREGEQYTLRSIRAEKLTQPGRPLEVFTDEQIAAMLEIQPGDVYSRDVLARSLDRIEEAYGLIGYLDVRVEPFDIYTPGPEVDLLLGINEGRKYSVGLIRISGNFLTKDKVIRRLVRLEPGRPYNTVRLDESEVDIGRTRLFNDVRITVQDPDPANPGWRDLLVEVKERNTGSVNFGLAVGSDAGVFGDFSVIQNNFDIADVPQSFTEMFKGRAFRGAGQRFALTFRPGNEIFQYSASLTEPHLFESQYSMTVAGAYRSRVYTDYDEERLSATLGFVREIGDIWNLGIDARFENVELTDIDLNAPTEVFADAGPDNLTSLGVALTRTTIDRLTRPGSGSRLQVGFEQFGVLGGDFTFSKIEADYTVYFTLDEDFLGRLTTLRLTSRLGYIFGDRAPTYERFYLGGRTFRGFEFRTVSPKGISALTGEPVDDPVGGNWLMFFGAQYEFPLFQETVTGVLFVDSGTVTDDVGFDEYRLSVGLGVRLYIPLLGPVPIAFDFGFSVLEEALDQNQVLSFSADLPF